jgi:RNA-directed DNA polymerase
METKSQGRKTNRRTRRLGFGFWGLYVHVCKVEILLAAYDMAKQNDGAPGIDGVTFEAIEAQGVEALLEQLRDELIGRTYQPLPARKQEIPKEWGKVRVLSIPAIRDRVVQGALKLILEPAFDADFQPGSFDVQSGQLMMRSSELPRR